MYRHLIYRVVNDVLVSFPCLFCYTPVDALPKESQNQDPSYKTDLDFWVCFGKENSILLLIIILLSYYYYLITYYTRLIYKLLTTSAGETSVL